MFESHIHTASVHINRRTEFETENSILIAQVVQLHVKINGDPTSMANVSCCKCIRLARISPWSICAFTDFVSMAAYKFKFQSRIAVKTIN